ncbi:hypothetical protein QQS21_000058 [Conoideocrella luteorostrata]|uniref:Uncharacterized protein n=1 Tax=Conoideocrella luteorostrata TaxID=1105319 RepID=A0AAJ0FYT9_9HYPO|nr:hypothetical protein QQS21_000058 [Conoideocrella luteorostrata]
MNKGYVQCSFSKSLSLNLINSNYVVAMSHTALTGNLDKYCATRVVVTIRKKFDMPFFICDGCERCGKGKPDGKWNAAGAPGLDFSYSALSEFSPQACFAGHIDFSWEVVDDTLYHLSTHYLDATLIISRRW